MRIDLVAKRTEQTPGDRFALYLIQHTDNRTKIFSVPYAQIEKDLGISQVSIARFFKTLEAHGSIIRAGRGKWIVPAVIGPADSDDGDGYFVENLSK